ncbi:CRAL/TRIO domain-containing protein [Rhizoclosmatium globosum]|uniref:CRAL/TRIO domain-containing protein n=1 Tax=Rhizoclosmatium globosum TaxID=329046 RepID=A0A1Y2CZR6_9FUNG|nr:CRAL/TRIO domain-containing protein [Rhizoclosmatium globosum]|eukprot:ORY52354.1 CRAL/TRIO domain-containing protein [Rhizoclosmatium globosum]
MPGHTPILECTKKIDIPVTYTEEQLSQTQVLTAWASESECNRYMRAAKWKPDDAKTRLQSTLQWRKEYRPDLISADEVEPEAVTGKQFLTGFDKVGQPLLFMVPGKENTKTYDRQIRFTVYLLEKAVKLMPAGVEKVDIIVDFETLNMFNAVPMSVSMKFLNVFANHYPERLGKCIMVNPSWYLSVFFKLISPFLDPVTKAKIYFCKVDRSGKTVASVTENAAASNESGEGTGGWVNSMQELAAAEQLPIEFGGTFDFEYSHSEYWPALKKV